MRVVSRWLGIGLQAAAAIWLLGWLQGNDPDCVLETGIILQIRMCDAQAVDDALASPALHLLAIALLFVVGYVCMRWSAQPEHKS
ncbi:MAG: hypothetical protein V4858_24490 [Pseudomonadota bacterium]